MVVEHLDNMNSGSIWFVKMLIVFPGKFTHKKMMTKTCSRKQCMFDAIVQGTFRAVFPQWCNEAKLHGFFYTRFFPCWNLCFHSFSSVTQNYGKKLEVYFSRARENCMLVAWHEWCFFSPPLSFFQEKCTLPYLNPFVFNLLRPPHSSTSTIS